MAAKKYDLIVIGAGSGGLGISLGMLEFGFKVLLIDKSEEKIGGECLNTGCVPSKSLIHVANLVHTAGKAKKFGLEVFGEVTLEKALGYVREKQGMIREHENADYFRKKGMDVVLGTARFVSRDSVEVESQVFSAKKIVIATGSHPRMLDIPGMETIPVYNNENIFDIDFLPKHFLFVGAGPLSIELGQTFSRLGSKVTLVEHDSRILAKEDPWIGEVLFKKLKEEGIEFILNSEVSEITSEKLAVIKNRNKDTEKRIPVDAVLMGVGRELNFEGLELEKAGVAVEDGRVKLNERLQTTNKKIYVSGDAAANMQFSHAAEYHNMLLLNNFLSPIKKKLNFDHFSWVTYTEPEVATFGLNEEQLKERGCAYERLEQDFSEEDRAVIDDVEYGRLLLFIEKKRFNVTGAKVLGGSLVVPKAGEIVQELILANSAGIPVKEIMNKIYPYPTVASAHKAMIRNRFTKELTPWIKKAVRWMYKL